MRLICLSKDRNSQTQLPSNNHATCFGLADIIGHVFTKMIKGEGLENYTDRRLFLTRTNILMPC